MIKGKPGILSNYFNRTLNIKVNMNIRTMLNPYNVVYKVADSSTSSFPNLVPTTTLPAVDGVIKMAPNTHYGQTGDNTIRFIFYGTGANDATFQAQIVFWNKVPGLNSQTQFIAGVTTGFDLWIPEIIMNVDGILGAQTGVAGTYIDNTHFFADTLSITSSTSNTGSNEIISPSNDTVASLAIDMSGPQLIEVIFKVGTATGMNAAYKTY